ncbi:hypothetical protein AAU57_10805 [Nonlabens sp. YIK11]|uniref:hypothetical protein n=1 Tax=Nonlabens sp. YIK11 TaxID=1453349 RepID=UPI0006DBE162|nr:hypothetical protein [Nonlabens sp. YIK11]KQC33765.1 hypothetical protein AAU57_10805 [Nonlabens sp. YIK11]
MKYAYFLLAIVLTVSCNDAAVDNDVVGAWKLSESMNDIGDGNATYRKVESDKTLLFTAYGTVISNQNVCIGNNFKEGTVAEWNPNAKEFSLEDCTASYELDEATGELTVTYQCMEACGERYVRAD